ncbi:MAG: DUF4340 domain-containing protein [Deltaproteobacteria bacterium]
MRLGRRTLLFAAIALALGLYIYLVEGPRLAEDQAPRRLLVFEPAQVSGLRLVYPDAPDISAHRVDGTWRITEPLQARADSAAIERLLSAIANVELERMIGAGQRESLDVYGLDGNGSHALVELTLEGGGDPLPPIIVGRTTPVGFSAFARLADSPDIVVTPLLFHSGVKKSVFDLRNKSLFDFDPTHAIAMTIDGENGRIRLERRGDRWLITSPTKGGADRDVVAGILASFNRITATALYEGKQIKRREFGLKRPTLSVEVEVGDSQVLGFKLGAQDPEDSSSVFFERIPDGQVAKVAAGIKNGFDKSPDQLRDKRLFDCKADQVSRIQFVRDDGSRFVLVKHEDAWALEAAADQAVDQAAAGRLAASLTTLRGAATVGKDDDSRFGLDPPRVEVALWLANGDSCGRGLGGRVESEGQATRYFIKRAGHSAVMSVAEYLFSRIDRRVEDFLTVPR